MYFTVYVALPSYVHLRDNATSYHVKGSQCSLHTRHLLLCIAVDLNPKHTVSRHRYWEVTRYCFIFMPPQRRLLYLFTPSSCRVFRANMDSSPGGGASQLHACCGGGIRWPLAVYSSLVVSILQLVSLLRLRLRCVKQRSDESHWVRCFIHRWIKQRTHCSNTDAPLINFCIFPYL